MYPVLGQFGPFTFYTYTALIDLGLAVGLGWLYLSAPTDKKKLWFDAGLALVLGGFIGARLLYTFANFTYYAGHLAEMFEIWRGGLAWPGAVVGGLMALWAYCSRKGEAVGPIADALALPLVFLSFLAWGGCLAAGCVYGYEVAPGQLPAWLTLEMADIYGTVALRWPTQVAGLAWSLIALGLVAGMRQRAWGPGVLSAYALSLIALGLCALSFTRADPMPLISNFRADLVGSACVLVGASIFWARQLLAPPPLISPSRSP